MAKLTKMENNEKLQKMDKIAHISVCDIRETDFTQNNRTQ